MKTHVVETHVVETHVSVGCFHFIVYASNRYFGLLVCSELTNTTVFTNYSRCTRLKVSVKLAHWAKLLAVAVMENTLTQR